jgi:hypothetical protein
MEYAIWDDEEEAAGIAAAMEDEGGASIAGVQFPDGTVIAAEDWAALAEARERRWQAWVNRPGEEPRPKRKITAPFGGGQIEIDASEPSWLGSPVIAAAVPDRKSPRARGDQR